ncbi:GAF domain-containing protein [Actinoplanes sp. CA-252034]|uniref:GAF domain-containing protein n=1 Tax=Actinoplanes sp. CA-252034 TaxID=3239906 RepID=UPI003D990B84
MLSKDDMLRDVVAALGRAPGLTAVQQLVRTSARVLADAHGATVVLREGDRCFYADEDAISPLWKGQRFPITECISGWAILSRLPAVVPDVRVDERIPQDAYRPTFVRSLAMIPVRAADPLGAVGVYWSTARRATDEELARLSTLAEATGAALERLLPPAATIPSHGGR